jgi:3-methylcrotonyl-CoA carboxylase alpha subunit
MKRILIANRGEIACRIIECCKKLNIHSIAVYSDIDKNSKHVRLANEAIHIGSSKAKESYLSTENILDAALKTNTDAIHPGYGFLAENDQFAKKIIDSGIIWIGPTPETIISMGNKETARALAAESGVPICPGINQNELEEESLEEKCNTIGFPILVKASAGGGGIGMQIAKDYNQLKEVIEKTKNLAGKAFGNSDIFLEKYIANARHIEIQIFGYGEKKAIHLYERDCSLQRRFQKIIEESPAPNIERETINQMSECAVNFSSNQKYEGAGTVEFVYDVDNKKFYFLEMNTRIQVEHPVTEQITGLDLVEMQIKFALKINDHTLQQDKILRSGHAIECRLYAEDPSKNFLPSPGKISKLSIPKLTSTDRLDIGVDEGDEISFYYDPMVAKVITQGENRDDSINNMIQLLNEIEIEGISSNKSFLLTVLENKVFLEANFNTKFIENNLDFLLQKKEKIKSLKVDKEATEKLRKEKANTPPPQATPTIKKKSNQKKEASAIPVPPIIGEIYDKPKFLPGGDKYMLIEFGNVMDLELNFTAQNLAQAIQDHKVTGVYETAPCFASMLVHYEPEEIKFNDLKNEMKSLIDSLGPTDDIEINSRIFSFPTVYLDKWTQECIEDYSNKIVKKKSDPELITEVNNLESTDQFVRVHSGTEYWVAAIGFWPGLPFMMALDPRCKLTVPKYNPPRTWTPKGTVGMGGSSTSIYPDRLPGGYQIFGIIPVPIWDTKKSFPVFENNICLFKPGDRVKFVPTTYEEFEHVLHKVEDGTYDYNIIEYQKFSVKNYKKWLSTIDKTKRF